jgi:pimeloyl-ACP methyl ester carboxylesterase
MSTFVFVHGGFHGGWSWDLVRDVLVRNGHTVHAPDLPGHGDEPTPQPDITYDMATGRIRAIVEGAREPVVLIGHSMSGLIITKVAEDIPDKVKMLVWIGAFLCPSGYSLKSYLQEHAHIGQNNVLPNTTAAADGSHVIFNLAKAREVFYHTTPADLAAQATSRLKPVALPYLTTPVHWTAERFGRIPRTYIVCAEDVALPPSLQRNMIKDLPCAHVFELPSDHSPFEGMPDEVARILMSVA